MVDSKIVNIIVQRIITKGLNPKTGKVYTTLDITNIDYLDAVQNELLKLNSND